MGRYLNPSDQGERLRQVLEMVPSGPQTAIPRTPKQVHRRLQPLQVDEVVSQYLAGATLKELGKQYQVHQTTISELLEQRGVQRRYRSLSVDRVAEAVKLYESGLSLVRVGNLLQVNSGTVWQALKGRGVQLRDCHGRTRPTPQDVSPSGGTTESNCGSYRTGSRCHLLTIHLPRMNRYVDVQ
jgi:hypothetical protein